MKNSIHPCISLPALIVFTCCSSFTFLHLPSGIETSYFFEFDDTHFAPTLFNVQDESKWIPVSGLGACDNIRVKACRIQVSREHVRGGLLLPTATIIAQESKRDTAFVTGGYITRFINKK